MKPKREMDISEQIRTLSQHKIIQAFIESLDFRVARTRQEWEQAYSLVYKEYLKRKYINPSPSELRLSIYNILPQTTTFVIISDKEVLGTATVIPDSPLGLPMDKLYKEELDILRKNKKKLCEISMLAINTNLFREGVYLLLNAKKLFLIFYLFKTIFDYVNNIDMDLICITINPKHKLTYDFLLFKDLGNPKTYTELNNAPAIAKYLDLSTVEEECKKNKKEGLYKMFFLQLTIPEKFDNKFRLSLDDIKFFFVKKTNLLEETTPQILSYIQTCYPEYNLEDLLK